jgi:hypothetical protein
MRASKLQSRLLTDFMLNSEQLKTGRVKHTMVIGPYPRPAHPYANQPFQFCQFTVTKPVPVVGTV